MRFDETGVGARGLEPSCAEAGAGWIASGGSAAGVELLRAWFAGPAYARHRHDTYAIGVTERGVQVFDYRGARRASTPGRVMVLHPDEPHDGRAGTDAGFGYRIVYVRPSLVADAVEALAGRPRPLPFVPDPVSGNVRLMRAVRSAFGIPLEPLAVDSLVTALARGLLATQPRVGKGTERRTDAAAVERARRFLDAEPTRAVRSAELEAVTGLTRYELARQFKLRLGTSPYRYLVMRRLDLARQRIRLGGPLADVACEAGFADQPHLTRAFKAAFGLTPARYRSLCAPGAGAARPL